MAVSASERACNNFSKLSGVSYDWLTHTGAHITPYSSNASTGFSSCCNQFFNTMVQLDAGVRLLTARVHASSNLATKAHELRLCHTACVLFDAGSFKGWLWEIRLWLDGTPNEVVTLMLVNYYFTSAREIEEEYLKAHVAHYNDIPANLTKTPVMTVSGAMVGFNQATLEDPEDDMQGNLPRNDQDYER